jgi:ssDNA-binding Zn-finger/Zn-ribbon topoisomerase 1
MPNKQCAHADLPPTDVLCPSCKQGTLEVRRGRFGPIYKCTSEGCNFWLPERPTGKKCSHVRDGKKCGALMVMGTKTIPDRCSDKACPNRNPHKLQKASA